LLLYFSHTLLDVALWTRADRSAPCAALSNGGRRPAGDVVAGRDACRPAMPVVQKRPAPRVVRTRAVFRREYEEHLAVGGEAKALEEATAGLEAARARLGELRARRVDLVRRTAEHVRKLSDWKGKVPRALGAGIPAGDAADAASAMPCKAIAVLQAPPPARVDDVDDGGDDDGSDDDSGGDDGRVVLHFRSRYVRALEGLERFAKAWVLLRPSPGAELGGRSWNSPSLRLVLVDVIERRGRSANNKEFLVVRGGAGQGAAAADALRDAAVVDVKPYLSYCESVAGLRQG
jgi:hypothetical protein